MGDRFVALNIGSFVSRKVLRFAGMFILLEIGSFRLSGSDSGMSHPTPDGKVMDVDRSGRRRRKRKWRRLRPRRSQPPPRPPARRRQNFPFPAEFTSEHIYLYIHIHT